MNILIFFVVVILILFILAVIIFVIIPLALMFGASFELTDDKTLRIMLKFARVKKGEKVAELGSGDGKLVIAFAKKGAEVHGYEINPFLVLLSKYKIRKEGLKGKAFVHWKNFWNVELGNFDVISVFQVGYVMPRLYKKLKREAKKKIRIVSNTWKFPNLRLLKEKGGVFYYEINPLK